MEAVADILLQAGRAGVELALFILLPVMVVMLSAMRLLESWGVLGRLVRWVGPLLNPLGIPGLGVFAMVQSLFVSFAAPMATLALMDRSGASERHLAATLCLALALAQGNVTFPLAAAGLDIATTLLVSVAAACIGASLTYHLFGRRLSSVETATASQSPEAEEDAPRGWMPVIQRAGRDALDITLNALPLLILALVAVHALRAMGAMGALEPLLAPLFAGLDLPGSMAVPIVTKFIAGGTAMMGVVMDLAAQGEVTAAQVNRVAGLLVHPLDLAGVAIIAGAGPRVARVVGPAALGAAVAIALRTVAHFLWF